MGAGDGKALAYPRYVPMPGLQLEASPDVTGMTKPTPITPVPEYHTEYCLLRIRSTMYESEYGVQDLDETPLLGPHWILGISSQQHQVLHQRYFSKVIFIGREEFFCHFSFISSKARCRQLNTESSYASAVEVQKQEKESCLVALSRAIGAHDQQVCKERRGIHISSVLDTASADGFIYYFDTHKLTRWARRIRNLPR